MPDVAQTYPTATPETDIVQPASGSVREEFSIFSCDYGLYILVSHFIT
jgi:hypothetical protein